MSDVGLDRLNRISLPDALRALGTCCGSSSWTFKMASGRPYANRADLLRFCELKFRSLTRKEWMEAFSHHTPIEEWIEKQGGFDDDELAEVNELARRYKLRFRHTFIVYTNGLSPAEIVGQLRRRLKHDPYDELLVAGEHQARITKEKLLNLLDLFAQSVEDVKHGTSPGAQAIEQRSSRPRSTVPFVPSRDGEYVKARGKSAGASDDQAKKSA